MGGQSPAFEPCPPRRTTRQSLARLRELDLCGNQIRGRGALAITKAVAQLPQLTSLQLDENEMSEAAIEKIKVCDPVLID